MQIKIKHKPGDIVYLMHDNQIVQGEVASVSFLSNCSGSGTSYKVVTSIRTFNMLETGLFPSVQALTKHLTKSVQELQHITTL